MKRFRYTSYLMAVMLLFSVSDSGHADEQLQALAAQGTAILKARCYGCHGKNSMAVRSST
jgi:mono/diheme cytochrome c family protein